MIQFLSCLHLDDFKCVVYQKNKESWSSATSLLFLRSFYWYGIEVSMWYSSHVSPYFISGHNAPWPLSIPLYIPLCSFGFDFYTYLLWEGNAAQVLEYFYEWGVASSPRQNKWVLYLFPHRSNLLIINRLIQ